jgi:hypothetical protein
MDDITGKQIALEELRRGFEKHFAASDALDNKLQNILAFSSAIVSVVFTIEVSVFQSKVGFVFWIPLGIALILYFISFKMIMKGLAPGSYEIPISKDWDELRDKVFNVTEENALAQIISQYLDSMDKIEVHNKRKASVILQTSDILMWIVVLLLTAIPLGLLFH